MRNEEVHRKKVAKQQKRKAKAAISVLALHNLQEIARPSDSFLVDQYIEEEIKHTMAAKLEGFIVIKTRPIHNSVSKGAERAKSKIQSMIE